MRQSVRVCCGQIVDTATGSRGVLGSIVVPVTTLTAVPRVTSRITLSSLRVVTDEL